MNNSKKDKRKIYLTEKEEEYIVYNYCTLHRGLNSIGKDIGVSGQKVKKVLKEKGIHINNLQEAMGLQRAHNVNDDYFKIQSHNMAYILGLLASDGCVAKSTNHITLDLQTDDEQILRDIKEELGSTAPINQYVNSHECSFSRLRICSKTIKDDLAHYGIVPQKTFSLTPPTFLNKEYYISYIRGYFDGDGCFYYRHRGNEVDSVWYICGAKKEVLEWMRQIFANQYGITTTEILKTSKTLSNGDPFYQLNFYGKKIGEIFKILYIDNTLKLNRKYLKMKELYDINSTRLHSSRVEEKSYAELIRK